MRTTYVGSPEWLSYQAMIGRCTRPSQQNFKWYGGRGISIDPEWRSSFLKFYFSLGPRPTGHTLDRRDNDGNYVPGNVHWLPRKLQQRHRRNVKLSEKTATEIRSSPLSGPVLSRKFGVTRRVINLIKRGEAWS